MIARSIRIAGRVQGVFFRDWTVDQARALGISGWVRNRRDGGVEVYAVGEEDTLDRLIARLHEGSPPSRVERVEVTDAAIEAVEGFVRRPTL
jgi:acylphosphatase